MEYIKLENVKKYYKETKALDDVTLSFEQNKVHGLIGRNGSGKTVMMKIICGLVKPTAGQVTVAGKVLGRDAEMPKNMGVIIENPGFIREYSGINNLKFLAGLSGKFHGLIRSLKEKGKTIILASHSSADISALCDTVNELDCGKFIVS